MAETEIEADVRFCRSADQALDAIERIDPTGHQLVTAALRAAVTRPPRTPVVPLRCRRAPDGRALYVAQAGRYVLALAGPPSDAVVDVVGVLLARR
jgi:hypothetical protein